MNRIRSMGKGLLGSTLLCLAMHAQAGPYPGPYAGGPDDGFVGCDGVGECSIRLDEAGNISASFNGFFGPYDIRVTHIAPTIDPRYAGLEVISYSVVGKGGAAPFRVVEGEIGFCESGVSADGMACIGPEGDRKGDVLIFRPGIIDADGYGHSIIDVLSDTEASFEFATDFNVLEIGPEGNNGGVYQTTATGWYGGIIGMPNANERLTYYFTSDEVAVPEPGSLALFGLGLLGLGYCRRRCR